jgi:hypothetical protein
MSEGQVTVSAPDAALDRARKGGGAGGDGAGVLKEQIVQNTTVTPPPAPRRRSPSPITDDDDVSAAEAADRVEELVTVSRDRGGRDSLNSSAQWESLDSLDD